MAERRARDGTQGSSASRQPFAPSLPTGLPQHGTLTVRSPSTSTRIRSNSGSSSACFRNYLRMLIWWYVMSGH